MNESKQEFLRRMNGELDSIDAQLDQFRTQFRNESTHPSTSDVSFNTGERLDALERRRDEIRRRSEELEDFAGDDWAAMRREIEDARNDLRRAVDEARNQPRH